MQIVTAPMKLKDAYSLDTRRLRDPLESAALSSHLLELRLMLYTIFWIFSSFFRMLAFTAQILSCWSLTSCSSSASSAFRGSTVPSVMLPGHKPGPVRTSLLSHLMLFFLATSSSCGTWGS